MSAKFKYQLIILCLISDLTRAHNGNESQGKLLAQVLTALEVELGYETILLLQNNYECFHSHKEVTISHSVFTPILQLNATQDFPLKSNFNSRFLALVCLRAEHPEDFSLLLTLYTNLQDIRDTPTLILVAGESVYNITELFESCQHNMILNVLALVADSMHTNFVYSYRAFPRLQLVRRHLSAIERYFEPQLRNLQGSVITTVPDNIMPRSVIYIDGQGQYKVTGYVANLIRMFAAQRNATLRISWDFVQKHELHTRMVSELMNNGLIDMPMCLWTLAFGNNFYYSYTIEISPWLLIVPMEERLKRNELYVQLIDSKRLIVILVIMGLLALLLTNARRLKMGAQPTANCYHLLGDHVLRAMLSQSFVQQQQLPMPQIYIYGLLLLSGFMISNIFTSSLGSIFVQPPTKPLIKSFNDMRRANLKILIPTIDVSAIRKSLGASLFNNITDVFEVQQSADDYQNKRIQLNASFAYPAIKSLWLLLNEKQSYMQRPLFRVANGMEFHPFMPLALPLPRNSIFRHAFNSFILQTHSSGLYDHWQKNTFNDLVAVGKACRSHGASTMPYQDMRFPDLYWIWLTYIEAICACLLSFVLELMIHKYWHRLRVRNTVRKLLSSARRIMHA